MKLSKIIFYRLFVIKLRENHMKCLKKLEIVSPQSA